MEPLGEVAEVVEVAGIRALVAAAEVLEYRLEPLCWGMKVATGRMAAEAVVVLVAVLVASVATASFLSTHKD
jgi:hypothetical protein